MYIHHSYKYTNEYLIFPLRKSILILFWYGILITLTYIIKTIWLVFLFLYFWYNGGLKKQSEFDGDQYLVSESNLRKSKTIDQLEDLN